MKLEDQVVSLPLAKRLKELGVKQEAMFHWLERAYEPKPFLYKFDEWQDAKESTKKYGGNYCGAFTVAELGEMLPEVVECDKFNGDWCIVYLNGKLDAYACDDKSEADARAKMLIYLIEKGVVKP